MPESIVPTLMDQLINNVNYMFVTFTGLLAIVNPVGASAFFVTHPAVMVSKKLKLAMAKRASIALFIFLVVFAFLGEYVFRFMGITITAFQVAGGIFLFTLALDMLRGKYVKAKTLPEEQEASLDEEDISVIPLAMPLMAGPGSITMVIVAMGKSESWYQVAGLTLVIFIIAVITYLTLRFSDVLLKFLGSTGIRILTRVMGLMIASIAVQLVIGGLYKAFPILKNVLN